MNNDNNQTTVYKIVAKRKNCISDCIIADEYESAYTYSRQLFYRLNETTSIKDIPEMGPIFAFATFENAMNYFTSHELSIEYFVILECDALNAKTTTNVSDNDITIFSGHSFDLWKGDRLIIRDVKSLKAPLGTVFCDELTPRSIAHEN